MRIDLAEDKDIHRCSATIANRVLWIFQQVLRHHDRQQALDAVYIAAKEELERLSQPRDES